MQQTETIIVLVSEVVSVKGTGTHEYTLSDGPEMYRPNQLARHVGILWETIKKRISAYGPFSELIFYHGRIPKSLSVAAKGKHGAKKKEHIHGGKIGARFSVNGGLITRSGKILAPNTALEDKLYPPLPAEYEGTECRLSAKHDRRGSQGNAKTISGLGASVLLSKYNAKHYKGTRSFIRTEEFGSVPV